MAKKQKTTKLLLAREVLPPENSCERIGYAFKVQQKLNLLAHKLAKPEDHRIINDRYDNISWCGESIGTNMSIRITPNIPEDESSAHGYWVEVRFHLKASFDNQASATVWVEYGGPYFGQKRELLTDSDKHVYADSFEELVSKCESLVNSTIQDHQLLAAR